MVMHKEANRIVQSPLCFARTGAMAGPRIPTDVKPNQFVEANGYAREVVERTFRFSPKNLGKFAIFGIAVPALIYKGCVQEFVSAPHHVDGPARFPDRSPARALGASTRDPSVMVTRLDAIRVTTRRLSRPGAGLTREPGEP